MERQPISRAGYEKKKEEIRVLEEEVLPEITERIKEAREEGDLKENAEYHAQREQQGMVAAKVAQLKTLLNGCQIVDRANMPKGVVTFGSLITVKDLSDGMEEQYELVGPGEEDYDGEIMKILTSSPIAQSMMGKKVGDVVEADIPAGLLKLEITAIEEPPE